MSITITYAKNEQGQLVHYNEAHKNEKYFCIDCGEELVLKVSKLQPWQKYYRRPHFAHKGETNCNPETALHNVFKRECANLLEESLNNKKELFVSWDDCQECFGQHSYDILKDISSVKVEFSLGVCKPDIVLLSLDNKPKVVIEIVVSHKPEEKALEYYKNNNIAVIQIHLSSYDDIGRIPELLSKPTIVNFCLSPVCENCGKHKRNTKMRIIDISCWKCYGDMKMAVAIDPKLCYYPPHDFSAKECTIAEKHDVILKLQYSKQTKESYKASSCKHCDGFIGDFYIHNYLYSDFPYQDIEIGYKCWNCASIDNIYKLKQSEIHPCIECGGIMELKRVKDRIYWKCSNSPECEYIEEINILY